MGHRATLHPVAVPRPAAAGPVSFPLPEHSMPDGAGILPPIFASLLAFVCSGREAVRQDIQNNRAVAGWEPGGRAT